MNNHSHNNRPHSFYSTTSSLQPQHQYYYSPYSPRPSHYIPTSSPLAMPARYNNNMTPVNHQLPLPMAIVNQSPSPSLPKTRKEKKTEDDIPLALLAYKKGYTVGSTHKQHQHQHQDPKFISYTSLSNSSASSNSSGSSASFSYNSLLQQNKRNEHIHQLNTRHSIQTLPTIVYTSKEEEEIKRKRNLGPSLRLNHLGHSYSRRAGEEKEKKKKGTKRATKSAHVKRVTSVPNIASTGAIRSSKDLPPRLTKVQEIEAAFAVKQDRESIATTVATTNKKWYKVAIEKLFNRK